MYRLIEVTLKSDGTENAQVDTYDDAIVAEGKGVLVSWINE